MNRPPTALIILDGFGYSAEKSHNAIALAKTPHLNDWFAHYPHTLLEASGMYVGLLKDSIGNSECGHQTIGAGRIIKQPVTILDELISSGKIAHDKTLKDFFKRLKDNNSRLHIMGLLSDGGIHSHEHHAYELIKLAIQNGIEKISVHPFLDGRDTDPQAAISYIEQLQKVLSRCGFGTISSIHGRYYAMDRDKNWDRTQKSYDVLTSTQKTSFATPENLIMHFYKKNITDEFIPPTPLSTHKPIQHGDGVIFFNIRPERAVQLTEAFCNSDFDHFPTKNITLTFFITGISDPILHSDYGLVKPEKTQNTLFDVLEEHGLSIFTIAETEKFAHVTYFFNSRHIKRKSETRKAIPSLKLKTYKNNPEMAAASITSAVLESLQHSAKDFYLINYANADMVGHSGDLSATIKATEYIDTQLDKLKKYIVDTLDGTLYITADHGNAEYMWNEDTQQPHTSHTKNPVPFLMIKKGRANKMKLPLKTLADIAPFILKNLNLPIPKEMKAR